MMKKRVFTPDIVQSLAFAPEIVVRQSDKQFTTPATLDLRDLVLKTEDQGDSPKCAAYTATSWLEALMWRRTGKAKDYDPDELYAAAKKIEGNSDPGTTLRAILLAMVSLQWIDRSIFDVRVLICDNPTLRRIIHKYGTALLALNIGEQWLTHYGQLKMDTCSSNKVGGHAVTCCGYDRHGVYIQNSWGVGWGSWGFARLDWSVFSKEVLEVAYFANALDGMEG